MMDMKKKMESGEYEGEGTKCTCPECGYQGEMEEFEGDKSMSESSPSDMKPKNPKNKIRESIGRAIMEAEGGQEE